MTHDRSPPIDRETFERAIALIQKYQNENWRRARVNIICSEIKLLLNQELTRKTGQGSFHAEHSQ
jgi:hypothetical protein